MRKRRILVIDDSSAIHEDFQRVLCPEPAGDVEALDRLEAAFFGASPCAQPPPGELFEVESALQGQEGLAKVREAEASGRPYALAFLDYRMPPGWSGLETLRHLRQVAPTLPVVLCSAYADAPWEELAREAGGTPALVELRKPFRGQELYQLALTLTQPRGTPLSE